MGPLKSFYIISLLIATLLSFSCKNQSKSHDLSPSSEDEKVEISSEDKKAIDAFAVKIEETINNGDNTFLNDRLNIMRLSELSIIGLDLTPKEKTETRRGMNRSLPQAKQKLVSIFTSSHIRFIKFVHETKPALLFRVILEDGSFTYCELLLEKTTASDLWEIVDFYMYSNGKRTSEVMRDTMAQMLPSTGEIDNTMLKAMEQTQNIAKLNFEEKYQEAWDQWNKIDPIAHKNRIVIMQGYMAAFQIYYKGSEEIEPLKKMVSIMEKQYPDDAGMSIVQLSIHEINKDSKKYREAVQKIRDKVGNDPFLDFMEGNAFLIDGDNEKFLAAAKKFTDIEPDISIIYPMIWGLHMQSKNYKELAESFDLFKENFDVEVSAFKEDPDFKGFFDSPVGKDWLEKNSK